MRHLDLFTGIGGFALAALRVWGDEYEPVAFCERDSYCQALLKLRFPNVRIFDDIKTLDGTALRKIHLLTGGFPCQPFSHAGKRAGRDDERALWPEMFRVIRETHPTWVIAENVRGLLSIESGVAFEQVCLDLESIGYEVQPFVIPACAVDAPHRRDRVWIVGRLNATNPERIGLDGGQEERDRAGERPIRADESNDGREVRGESSRCDSHAPHASESGLQGHERNQPQGLRGLVNRSGSDKGRGWEANWVEVATRLCGVDDGLPAGVDGLELSKSRHRVERLKGLGNAIVPAVATVIMQAIKESDERNL